MPDAPPPKGKNVPENFEKTVRLENKALHKALTAAADSVRAPPQPASAKQAAVDPSLSKTLPLSDVAKRGATPVSAPYGDVDRVASLDGHFIPVLSAVAAQPEMLVPVAPRVAALRSVPVPAIARPAAPTSVIDPAQTEAVVKQADELLAKSEAADATADAQQAAGAQPSLTPKELAEMHDVGAQLEVAYGEFVRAVEALSDLVARLPG